jgi:hypothetical protein
MRIMSRDIVPQLIQGHTRTLIDITRLAAFETTDASIAGFKDLCDDLVTGKPGVEENKAGAYPVLPTPPQHLHENIRLFLESFHASFPTADAIVDFA